MKPFVQNKRATLKRWFKDFAQDCRGVALTEFAICLPLMILLLAGAVISQDTIRMAYLNNKEAYTLSDMVSREDVSIDTPYSEGLDSIFDFMTNDRYPTDLRVTTIECTANCTDEATRVIEVRWSKSSMDFAELTTDDIDLFALRTPLFAEGDTMLITETYLDYTAPAFQRFYGPRRYQAIAFTRPRITQQIKFDTGTSDLDGNTIFKDCFNNDA